MPPGVEIERKYLLDAVPERARRAPFVEIEQGWLPGNRIRERLRRARSGSGVDLLRTIKLGEGVRRIEVEEPIEPDLFEALWPLTRGCRVHKRRYRVEDMGLVWEVDEFTDRTLVLAEVELESEDFEPAVPSWLAPHVVREVTGDAAFVNLHLAR